MVVMLRWQRAGGAQANRPSLPRKTASIRANAYVETSLRFCRFEGLIRQRHQHIARKILTNRTAVHDQFARSRLHAHAGTRSLSPAYRHRIARVFIDQSPVSRLAEGMRLRLFRRVRMLRPRVHT